MKKIFAVLTGALFCSVAWADEANTLKALGQVMDAPNGSATIVKKQKPRTRAIVFDNDDAATDAATPPKAPPIPAESEVASPNVSGSENSAAAATSPSNAPALPAASASPVPEGAHAVAVNFNIQIKSGNGEIAPASEKMLSQIENLLKQNGDILMFQETRTKTMNCRGNGQCQ